MNIEGNGFHNLNNGYPQIDDNSQSKEKKITFKIDLTKLKNDNNLDTPTVETPRSKTPENTSPLPSKINSYRAPSSGILSSTIGSTISKTFRVLTGGNGNKASEEDSYYNALKPALKKILGKICNDKSTEMDIKKFTTSFETSFRSNPLFEQGLKKYFSDLEIKDLELKIQYLEVHLNKLPKEGAATDVLRVMSESIKAVIDEEKIERQKVIDKERHEKSSSSFPTDIKALFDGLLDIANRDSYSKYVNKNHQTITWVFFDNNQACGTNFKSAVDEICSLFTTFLNTYKIDEVIEFFPGTIVKFDHDTLIDIYYSCYLCKEHIKHISHELNEKYERVLSTILGEIQAYFIKNDKSTSQEKELVYELAFKSQKIYNDRLAFQSFIEFLDNLHTAIEFSKFANEILLERIATEKTLKTIQKKDFLNIRSESQTALKDDIEKIDKMREVMFFKVFKECSMYDKIDEATQVYYFCSSLPFARMVRKRDLPPIFVAKPYVEKMKLEENLKKIEENNKKEEDELLKYLEVEKEEKRELEFKTEKTREKDVASLN